MKKEMKPGDIIRHRLTKEPLLFIALAGTSVWWGEMADCRTMDGSSKSFSMVELEAFPSVDANA